MIEPIVLVVIGAASAVGVLAGMGYAEDDVGGCNGHHWGEPKRAYHASGPTLKGTSLDPDFSDITDYMEVQLGQKTVSLKEKAIKRCEDCGETQVVTVTVGQLPHEAFEEDEQVKKQVKTFRNWDK